MNVRHFMRASIQQAVERAIAALPKWDTFKTPPTRVLPDSDWYPRPELNRDQRFRKPLLYPFELRRQNRVEVETDRHGQLAWYVVRVPNNDGKSGKGFFPERRSAL